MRILAAVPGSVLLLYADNPWMRDNLQREAAVPRRGTRRG